MVENIKTKVVPQAPAAVKITNHDPPVEDFSSVQRKSCDYSALLQGGVYIHLTRNECFILLFQLLVIPKNGRNLRRTKKANSNNLFENISVDMNL